MWYLLQELPQCIESYKGRDSSSDGDDIDNDDNDDDTEINEHKASLKQDIHLNTSFRYPPSESHIKSMVKNSLYFTSRISNHFKVAKASV